MFNKAQNVTNSEMSNIHNCVGEMSKDICINMRANSHDIISQKCENIIGKWDSNWKKKS